MGLKIMNGEGNKIIITPEEFTLFWKKVGEFTSSSSLGVHYGHFKPPIQDQMSNKVLALQLTVIMQSRVPPESWSVGLQIMLEKIAGVCLVKKLQAIQLYKADFNCFNHFIFGQAAMDALNKNNYLPEELFSQKGCTAKDAKFDKTLIADLSRQARHPMTGVSAKVAYCYDRVNHVITSLVWLVLTGNTLSSDNEVLSTDRLWQFQILFWRHVTQALHDGTGTGKPRRPTAMDSTECCVGKRVQKTWSLHQPP